MVGLDICTYSSQQDCILLPGPTNYKLMLVGLYTPCIFMLAILNYVVDKSPISIEKKYIDANGDCNPHRILVKHNHLEDSPDGWGGEAHMGGRQIAQTRDKLSEHVMRVTIVTKKNSKATRTRLFLCSVYLLVLATCGYLVADFPSSSSW